MLLAKNKKALFNNEVIEKYMAGIVLKGYEVKAVREKNVNFEGSYIKIENGIPYIVGLHIGRYSKQAQQIEDTKAVRRLLLNKKEIEKIAFQIGQKGKTAIPIALLLKNNLIKLELAVVKGRKKFEKKVVEKEKQIRKDLERDTKDIRRASDL